MKLNLSQHLNKTIGISIGLISSLGIATPAFATQINPCPTTGFGTVCNLTSNQLGPLISRAVTITLIIATVIALFILIYGAILWITSGGDKAKVDTARKTIIGAIVGLILAFLAYFILTLVLGLFGLTVNNLTLPKLTP